MLGDQGKKSNKTKKGYGKIMFQVVEINIFAIIC